MLSPSKRPINDPTYFCSNGRQYIRETCKHLPNHWTQKLFSEMEAAEFSCGLPSFFRSYVLQFTYERPHKGYVLKVWSIIRCVQRWGFLEILEHEGSGFTNGLVH
jgi:hypothetical protein